jgi:hypothetical protein
MSFVKRDVSRFHLGSRFNPNHDESGKFTTGGGGGTPTLAGIGAQFQKAFPNALVNISPTLSGDQVAVAQGMANAASGLAKDYPQSAQAVAGLQVGDHQLETNVFGETTPHLGTPRLEGGVYVQTHEYQISMDAGQTTDVALFSSEPNTQILANQFGAYGERATPEAAGVGIMTHEFGHVVDGMNGWNNAGDQWASHAIESGVHISNYANSSPAEYFAEAFAGNRLGYGVDAGDKAMLSAISVRSSTPPLSPPPSVFKCTFEGSLVWWTPKKNAQRFNPNHDPNTGEFSEGQSGASTVAAGGFTTNIHTGQSPTTGYQVAVAGHALVMPADKFASMSDKAGTRMLHEYMDKNSLVFSQPGMAIGGWVENGQMYIEPSVTFSSLDEAIKQAQSTGQMEIWDNAKQQSITTGTTAARHQVAEALERDDIRGAAELLFRFVFAPEEVHTQGGFLSRFNPNHDEHGKFTTGGGGGLSAVGAGAVLARDHAFRAQLQEAFPHAQIILWHSPAVLQGADSPHTLAVAGAVNAATDVAKDYPRIADQVHEVVIGENSLPNGTYGMFSGGGALDAGMRISLDSLQIGQATDSEFNVGIGGGAGPQDAGYAVMTHEFGHAVDYENSANSGMVNGNKAWEAATSQNATSISQYAMTNPKEYFAEAFTANRIGLGSRLSELDKHMLSAGIVYRSQHQKNTSAVDIDDTLMGSVVWERPASKRFNPNHDESGKFAEGSGSKLAAFVGGSGDGILSTDPTQQDNHETLTRWLGGGSFIRHQVDKVDSGQIAASQEPDAQRMIAMLDGAPPSDSYLWRGLNIPSALQAQEAINKEFADGAQVHIGAASFSSSATEAASFGTEVRLNLPPGNGHVLPINYSQFAEGEAIAREQESIVRGNFVVDFTKRSGNTMNVFLKSAEQQQSLIRFNPNHDESGKFASGSSGGGIAGLVAKFPPNTRYTPESGGVAFRIISDGEHANIQATGQIHSTFHGMGMQAPGTYYTTDPKQLVEYQPETGGHVLAVNLNPGEGHLSHIEGVIRVDGPIPASRIVGHVALGARFNPNHDETGKFTTGSGGASLNNVLLNTAMNNWVISSAGPAAARTAFTMVDSGQMKPGDMAPDLRALKNALDNNTHVSDVPLARALTMSGDIETLQNQFHDGYQFHISAGGFTSDPAMTGQFGHAIIGESRVVFDLQPGAHALPIDYSLPMIHAFQSEAENIVRGNYRVLSSEVQIDPTFTNPFHEQLLVHIKEV